MSRSWQLAVVALAASVYFAANSPAVDSRPPKYTIDNCVNSFDNDKIERTDAGYVYWFADKSLADGKTLKLSVVGPQAASHPPHVHDEDEFFFVLEGQAEFHLDGETTTGGPMTSFYCPSAIAHGIRNVGDKELKYLVIKKYPTRD